MKNSLIVVALFTFIRCSNPIGPTGGEKDIKPPVITKIKITDEKDQKKITIIFDENINTKGSISTSPITNKKTIELNKHRNSLWFNVPQNTNSITLNDIITDVNENNPGKYPFIILGKDSSKYIVKYQSMNPQKDKIKGYTLIDSFYYPGDYSTKGIISIGGLKKQEQLMYIFNDINNNEKYDIQEEYNIIKIKQNNLLSYNDTIKDTTKVYLYPPKLKEIKRSVNQKDSLAIYTQLPTYFIKQEKEKENIFLLQHNDTLVINMNDTNYIDQQINSSLGNIKIIPSKTEISENGNIILKMGIFEKDTMIQYDLCLAPFYKKIKSKEFNIPTIKEIQNTKKDRPKNNKIEFSIYSHKSYNAIIENLLKKYNTTGINQNKKDSLYKKIKIKLGKTLIKIKKDSLQNWKVKFINEKLIQQIFPLTDKENNIILETGNYRYIIWDDSNNNNELDIYSNEQDIIHENIQVYMKETAVNSKLDNIIIVE